MLIIYIIIIFIAFLIIFIFNFIITIIISFLTFDIQIRNLFTIHLFYLCLLLLLLLSLFSVNFVDIVIHYNRLHHLKRQPPLPLLLLTCLFSYTLVDNPKPKLQQPVIQRHLVNILHTSHRLHPHFSTVYLLRHLPQSYQNRFD